VRLPLDLVERVGGQQPTFDGVAEGIGEHGPLVDGNEIASAESNLLLHDLLLQPADDIQE